MLKVSVLEMWPKSSKPNSPMKPSWLASAKVTWRPWLLCFAATLVRSGRFPIECSATPVKQMILSPLELHERLRSERTNLVSKIVEKWKDVAPALLQQMDWQDSLSGTIGIQNQTFNLITGQDSFQQ